jgi:hypothetical protein
MDLIKNFLKSLGEEEAKEVTLSKSVQDNEESLEALLKKADTVVGLQKSEPAPENASVKAAEEAAESKEEVFSKEEKMGHDENKKEKKEESTIPENASIKAEHEKAESKETVFSAEKRLDKEAPAGKQVEIALQKAKKAEKEEECEEEEEEEEKKEIGEKMMKSAGLSQSDIEVFDVTIPMSNLRKSYNVLASEITDLKKQQSEMIDLFKSLLTVQVKGFSLQKNVASAIESFSNTPNQVKGRVNILHKSFEQNKEVVFEETPSIQQFTDTMLKSMEAGKIGYDVASRLISSVEMTENFTEEHMSVYNKLK